MTPWLCALLATGVLGPYHTSGPLQGSLRRDAPAPVYSDDPADPWNRIHHLLFTTRVEVRIHHPVRPRRGAAPTLQSLVAGQVELWRLEGGDMPEFLFTIPGWDHLVRSPRYGALVAVLEGELSAPHVAGRTPEARVLFQQDLWSRFDLLAVDWEGAGRDAQPRRERLRSLLGRLIARVALSRDALLRIPSNLDAIARAHPEVDPDLLRPSPWRELIRVGNGGPEVTAHAETAGHRRVFRVFRKVPEGARDESADGTRVLLLETLLALSDAGEIVPLPLVVSVQSRELRRLDPGADARLDVADLPFGLLHASRRAFASAASPAGGLVAIASDEPIPQIVGCFPRSRNTPLMPARIACIGCHGSDGRHLMTFSFQGTLRVDDVSPDNTIAQDAVLRVKQASPSFRALRALFARD